MIGRVFSLPSLPVPFFIYAFVGLNREWSSSAHRAADTAIHQQTVFRAPNSASTASHSMITRRPFLCIPWHTFLAEKFFDFSQNTISFYKCFPLIVTVLGVNTMLSPPHF